MSIWSNCCTLLNTWNLQLLLGFQIKKTILPNSKIQAYKIINGHDHVSWCSLESFQLRPTFSTGSQTRGHRFKITEREIVRNCEHQFFTNRCIGNWNSLPGHMYNVEAQSTNSFKALLDKNSKTV